MEPESRAVDALAEYALYQEQPRLARGAFLREALNQAIGDHAIGADEPITTMLVAALDIYSPEWLGLLDTASSGLLAELAAWHPGI